MQKDFSLTHLYPTLGCDAGTGRFWVRRLLYLQAMLSHCRINIFFCQFVLVCKHFAPVLGALI